MFQQIRKRDGSLVDFDQSKITHAIERAARACGGTDMDRAARLSRMVVFQAESRFGDRIPDVEELQDLVEETLIRNSHVRTAKAYILYRERRKNARNQDAMAEATIEMFDNYLNEKDWRINENANQQRSVNGLNNYVREHFTQYYWLKRIYPTEVSQAHESGDAHIHDLGFLGPYCAGWDLRQLLTDGFGGVSGKVESRPAKHLRSFLGQIVNSTFTTQGECAGAQAWSSIDTYCAPFIRHDNLSFDQVKQCLQEFIFNLNVPTRVGFQCPFSNLTFDIRPPKTLENTAVIIGGEPQESTYGEYQAEMDLFNQAFCAAMMEGDAKGRVFTFPVPTLNIVKDFPWESPAVKAFMELTRRYGSPYFANYVNSDLNPEDAVSMCCRLRLDTRELRKRGGGLFGSNPLTGSIGVYTINLPRLGYKASSEKEFLEGLFQQLEIGRTHLEIKRKVIEDQTERGLYPYSAHYLRNVKERTGEYWYNHFNTIGIVGMHEAMQNLYGRENGIQTPEGKAFAIRVLNFIRDTLRQFQDETHHVYNLEATPAEGTSYRLARIDKQRYPQIITSGTDEPYYTNSAQLPVGYTNDILTMMDHQDDIQSLYTGGTVQHLYMGESPESGDQCAALIQRLFSKYKMPYVSITPTFSVCPDHGYIKGEKHDCPTCHRPTEIWTRVTGYLRPVQHYNLGKKEEFKDRQMLKIESAFESKDKDAVCA